MLELTDFRPVTLQDREAFKRHYEKHPPVHSDNTFANMVCWSPYAHYQHAFVRDSVVIQITIDGKSGLRDPIGPVDAELFDRVLHLATQLPDPRPFYILNPATASWIREHRPQITLHADRNVSEYVYLRSDLARLPGKTFLAIRKQWNRFQARCTSSVEPITAGNLQQVRGFLKRWCQFKNCDAEPLLAGERDAAFFAIANFEQLGLSGLAIRINDEIAAMAIYEHMSNDTVLVHFEKALPVCEGIYKAINVETARHLPETCMYINRASDMGVPGLREAKTRYHPHHMLETWYIKMEEL
jgi:uncharacterized protein